MRASEGGGWGPAAAFLLSLSPSVSLCDFPIPPVSCFQLFLPIITAVRGCTIVVPCPFAANAYTMMAAPRAAAALGTDSPFAPFLPRPQGRRKYPTFAIHNLINEREKEINQSTTRERR